MVRAGYGINYNLGQYGSIVQNLAAQPPFLVYRDQRLRQATGPSPYTMASGFPTTTATSNNYGVDPNYRVAYVQLWNLNVQRELSFHRAAERGLHAAAKGRPWTCCAHRIAAPTAS